MPLDTVDIAQQIHSLSRRAIQVAESLEEIGVALVEAQVEYDGARFEALEALERDACPMAIIKEKAEHLIREHVLNLGKAKVRKSSSEKKLNAYEKVIGGMQSVLRVYKEI
jgi:hypothetical protein